MIVSRPRGLTPKPRTQVKDFDKVQTLVKEGKIKNIVVVGGGFLGCQVAAKLAETGRTKQVEVHPAPESKPFRLGRPRLSGEDLRLGGGELSLGLGFRGGARGRA